MGGGGGGGTCMNLWNRGRDCLTFGIRNTKDWLVVGTYWTNTNFIVPGFICFRIGLVHYSITCFFTSHLFMIT
jgi:hypothetical protein